MSKFIVQSGSKRERTLGSLLEKPGVDKVLNERTQKKELQQITEALDRKKNYTKKELVAVIADLASEKGPLDEVEATKLSRSIGGRLSRAEIRKIKREKYEVGKREKELLQEERRKNERHSKTKEDGTHPEDKRFLKAQLGTQEGGNDMPSEPSDKDISAMRGGNRSIHI